MGITKKNTIPFLLVILIISVGMAYAQIISGQEEPTQDIASVDENTADDGNIALYDLLFPETDISDEIKEKIIDNMLNPEIVDAPIPSGQKELAERAAALINEIKSTTDKDVAESKQRQLDMMTVPLLKAGIVVAEKYKQDPLVWKELLEEFEQEETQDIRTVP